MSAMVLLLASSPRTLVLSDGRVASVGWAERWGLDWIHVPSLAEVPVWAWWVIGAGLAGLLAIVLMRGIRRAVLEWRCGDDAAARMWLLLCDRLGVRRGERRALVEMAAVLGGGNAGGKVPPVCLLLSPGTFGLALSRLRTRGKSGGVSASVLRDAERLARRWRVEEA